MEPTTPAFADAVMLATPTRARAVATGSALLALACVLGLVEASLPPLAMVPWLRVGLANIAIVIALVVSGVRMAAFVSGGRLLVVGLATGTLAGPVFVMGLAGAVASLAVMACLKALWRGLTPVGWSAAGSVAHVMAQLAVAAGLTGSISLMRLAPVSSLLALVLGAAIGALSTVIVSRLPLRQS